MSASFDLSRTPLRDASTVASARWVANVVTGFLVIVLVILVVFYVLYAERWGGASGFFLVPLMVAVLAMIPFHRLAMRLLSRQSVRFDLGPEGVVFRFDVGTTRLYRWDGSVRQLLWVDGRGSSWPKLRPGWPTTSVASTWWGPLAILPESAFDQVLATARGRGLRAERQVSLEKLPRYRGNVVYRVIPSS